MLMVMDRFGEKHEYLFSLLAFKDIVTHTNQKFLHQVIGFLPKSAVLEGKLFRIHSENMLP